MNKKQYVKKMTDYVLSGTRLIARRLRVFFDQARKRIEQTKDPKQEECGDSENRTTGDETLELNQIVRFEKLRNVAGIKTVNAEENHEKTRD